MLDIKLIHYLFFSLSMSLAKQTSFSLVSEYVVPEPPFDMWKQGKGIDVTVIVGKYYVILKYYMDGWSDIDTVMEYMCLKLLQICSNCRGLNFINTYLILISHNSNRHRYQQKEHNVCHMLNAICSPFPSNWHHPRVLYKFLLLSF